MAALAPILPVATALTAGLGLVSTIAEAEARSAEARRQAREVEQQRAADGRVRRDALRRAVARRRASLGGQGVDSAAGSGEALLLGLVERSALEGEADDARARARLEAIRSRADRQRLNLLDQVPRLGTRFLDSLG